MRKSLHILADFYSCRAGRDYLTQRKKLETKALTLIRLAGFSIISSRFHKFPSSPAGLGGITGVVIVSESHLTIHTWPEKSFLNLDVFFCNYRRDNAVKGRLIFSKFQNIFKPERVRKREVWRD